MARKDAVHKADTSRRVKRPNLSDREKLWDDADAANEATINLILQNEATQARASSACVN